MAAKYNIVNELGPSLEEILSRHGLKLTDLDRECPRFVRDEIAVKLDDWEMVGRCLEFEMEKLRDIDRENRSQELCRIALLDTWGQREGKRATYLKLANVLYRRQRRDLVEFLCAKLKSTLTFYNLTFYNLNPTSKLLGSPSYARIVLLARKTALAFLHHKNNCFWVMVW